VVPEAASPLGADGLAEQLLAEVVTLNAALCDEAPKESEAATEKLYAV
jgi:hypothetical protein